MEMKLKKTAHTWLEKILVVSVLRIELYDVP